MILFNRTRHLFSWTYQRLFIRRVILIIHHPWLLLRRFHGRLHWTLLWNYLFHWRVGLFSREYLCLVDNWLLLKLDLSKEGVEYIFSLFGCIGFFKELWQHLLLFFHERVKLLKLIVEIIDLIIFRLWHCNYLLLWLNLGKFERECAVIIITKTIWKLYLLLRRIELCIHHQFDWTQYCRHECLYFSLNGLIKIIYRLDFKLQVSSNQNFIFRFWFILLFKINIDHLK